MNTPNTRADIAAATGANPDHFVIPSLYIRLSRYAHDADPDNHDPSADAAHLLARSLEPLVAMAADAEVTLPAEALQALLTELHNRIHGQRASIRALVDIAYGHIPAELLREPAFNGMEVQA